MSDSLYDPDPAIGLYERLITERLRQRVDELRENGWTVSEAPVVGEEADQVLVHHISEVIRERLAGLTTAEQVLAANLVLNAVDLTPGSRRPGELVTDELWRILAISKGADAEKYSIRPTTPLTESAPHQRTK